MKIREKIENFIIDFVDKYYILGITIGCFIGFVVGVILGILWLIENFFKLLNRIFKFIFKVLYIIFIRPFFILKNKLLRIKIINKICRSIYSNGKIAFNSIYFEKFIYFLGALLVFMIANIAVGYLLCNYSNTWWLRVIFSVLVVNYFKPDKEEKE